MKKLLILNVALLAISFTCFASENDNSKGLATTIIDVIHSRPCTTFLGALGLYGALSQMIDSGPSRVPDRIFGTASACCVTYAAAVVEEKNQNDAWFAIRTAMGFGMLGLTFRHLDREMRTLQAQKKHNSSR